VVQRATPIAYWNLNETSGTAVADSAGAPQNGTFVDKNSAPDLKDDGPPSADAPYGAQTGADFHDTTQEYIAVAKSSELEVESGTVELWFKTRDATDTQTLFSKDHNGFLTGGHLDIAVINRDIEVRLQSTSQSFLIDTDGGSHNNLVKSDTWYHLALTFGPDGMKLYVDGELVGTNAYTGGLQGNHEPIVIGGSIRTNSNDSGNLSKLTISRPFDGYIDEVAFFDVALDPSQIILSQQYGPLGVIAPADLGTVDGTDTLVSIEGLEFVDPPSATTTSASALAPSTFSLAADPGLDPERFSAAKPTSGSGEAHQPVIDWSAALGGEHKEKREHGERGEREDSTPAWIKDFLTESGRSAHDRGADNNFRLEASSAGDPPKHLFKLPRNSEF
jgi:Concanavalin A-like lectin/glucanases superfamily